MIDKKYSKMGSNRSFGLVFFIVFLIISMWSFRGDFHQIKTIPLYISIVFLILGLMNSKILTPLNKIWYNFGLLLGNIISPIVMGMLYFLVITPIGLFMRIIGKDLLNIKYNKTKISYWNKRERMIGTMKNQF